MRGKRAGPGQRLSKRVGGGGEKERRGRGGERKTGGGGGKKDGWKRMGKGEGSKYSCILAELALANCINSVGMVS